MNSDQEDGFQARMNILISRVGSITNLAEKSHLSRRIIDNYKAGKADPSRKRLVALARAGDVRLEWLAAGIEPMTDDSPYATVRPTDEAGGVPIYDAVLSMGPGRLNGDTVQPIGFLDLPGDYLRNVLHCPPDKAVAVYADGNSMAPTLVDRELAILDTSVTTLARDDVYAFSLAGEGYIKRLQRAGAVVVVHSDNQDAYRDWTITGEQLADLRIIGRLAGAIRRT